MNRALHTLGKLGLTGLLVSGVGLAILTLDPRAEHAELEVKSAEADITAFDFAPTTKHERFIEALDEAGMEDPREYSYNDNTFFFSMMKTEDSPNEVLRNFQRLFVEKGINKKIHDGLPEGGIPFDMADIKKYKKLPEGEQKERFDRAMGYWEHYDDFFGGGIVPFQQGPDHIVMHGTRSKGKADGALEFLQEQFQSGEEKIALDHLVGTMYTVEAFRSKTSRTTTVTAVWSDENLDIPKLKNPPAPDPATEYDFPRCMGCEHQMSFKGHGNEKDYETHVYTGSSTVDAAANFYRTTMEARGWKLSPAIRIMDKAMAKRSVQRSGERLLQFARGTDFMTVLVKQDPRTGEVSTQLLSSP